MSRILQTASVLLEQLQSLQPLKPEDQQRLDKKFRLSFSYNSNHLEGNTLTYSETELLLIFGDAPGNHTMRELEEMTAHDAAWRMVEEWTADREHELSERDIKNLNEIILVKPFWKDAQTPDGQSTRRLIKVGSYKEQPNSVRLQNGEIFQYASPTDTPMQMGDLIAWYRSKEAGELHPVERAALLHYRFVRIHPFDDGNGRISRLLMNYALLKSGYPPVIIKSEAKGDYLRALHRADVGELDVFVDYVAEGAIASLQLSLKAANGESVDEPGDFEKRIARLQKQAGTPEQVTVKYGKQIFRDTFETLEKFFLSLEEKMKQIDTLVFSRNVKMSTDKVPYTSENTFTSIWDSYAGVDEDIVRKINSKFPPKSIEFEVQLELRDTLVKGGKLLLCFYENFYEIGDEQSILGRIYYGPENAISKEKSEEIASQFSNGVLAILEEELRS